MVFREPPSKSGEAHEAQHVASSGSCGFISPPVPPRNKLLWPCRLSFAGPPAWVSLFFCHFYVSPRENTTCHKHSVSVCQFFRIYKFQSPAAPSPPVALCHLLFPRQRPQRTYHGALSPEVTFLTAALQLHRGPQRTAQPTRSTKPSACWGAPLLSGRGEGLPVPGALS